MSAKRPNLFLLGAPKCGTTSLANLMAKHREIFVPSVKEPHFFSRLAAVPLTESQYLGLYKSAPESARWLADCSTCSLFEPHYSLPVILKFSESPRFIVMIRSPVEMCVSLHNEEFVHCNESVADIGKALDLQNARLHGEEIPRVCLNPLLLQYFDRCRVGSQLEVLYSIVPRDDVLVLVLDDIREDEGRELARLSAFLNVEPFAESLVKNNAAKEYRSRLVAIALRVTGRVKRRLGFIAPLPFTKRLRSFNQKQREKRPTDPQLLRRLQDEFAEEISKLELLLGRDFSTWRRP